MSLAVIFGSTTGNTEDLAYRISNEFNGRADTPQDVLTTPVHRLLEYRTLILGVPTWNHGQLQPDWEERVDELENHSFEGRKVAFFGSGDAKSYPSSFQDAMGLLWQRFERCGAELIGKWPSESYRFESSRGLLDDGKFFVGLPLERHDHDDTIQQRIKEWVCQLSREI